MPSNPENVQQVMSSGIEALTLTYEPVRQFSTPMVYMRTSLNINSLELGILTPEQYRYVAQRTVQSEHLFQRHLHKLLQVIPGFMASANPISCFTVPAYARMLKNGTLSKVLFEEFAANPKVSSSKICIELSADLLFEELDDLVEELEKVRKLGVMIALTEVGDEFCPMLRLSRIPYTLAFLDPFPLSLIHTDREFAFEGLCEMIHAGGQKVIIPDLPTAEILDHLDELGCDGYTLIGTVHDTPVFSEDGDAEE